MVVGMSPDQVPGFPKPSDFPGIEESPPADQASGDEEMPQPSSTLELVGNVERAFATIVEGEQQMAARPGQVDPGHEVRPSPGGGNFPEVTGEHCGAELVGPRAVPLKPGLLRPVGDVMEAEAGYLNTGCSASRPVHTPARS